MKNKLANTVMEYVILIGTVSLIFVTMNMYIKRGLQGRVADMTDYFIGREHAADSNPTAESTSDSSTVSTSNLTTDLYTGGGMRLALLDRTDTIANSEVIDDPTKPRAQNYIPAERGYITLPVQPIEEDIKGVYDTEAENTKAQIRILKTRRDNLLLEAKVLEEKARIIDTRGRQLIRQAGNMDCHGNKSCRRARRNLSRTGQDMVKQAAQMREEARSKRQGADRIQTQINELEKELD